MRELCAVSSHFVAELLIAGVGDTNHFILKAAHLFEPVSMQVSSLVSRAGLRSSVRRQPPLLIPRWLPLLSALLQIAIGGIRFSDGQILLAIAEGHGIEDPVFQNPLTHYIWESPLKVWLLRVFPWESYTALAGLFLLLGCLPMVGLAWPKTSRFYLLTSGLILLTPCLKISVENLGVGDGAISFLTLMLVLCLRRPVRFAVCLLLLGLWHPGQAVFIAVSYCLGAWASGLLAPHSAAQSRFGSQRSTVHASLWILVLLSVLTVGASRIVLLLYNRSLGFHYVDRFGYVKLKLLAMLPLNLLQSPISLAFPLAYGLAVLWLCHQRLLSTGMTVVLLAWIAGMGGISLATTDVTRVAILCLSPLVLLLFEGFMAQAVPWRSTPVHRLTWMPAMPRRLVLMVLLAPLVPLCSWSGIDFSLWPDFVADLCKYGVACFG